MIYYKEEDLNKIWENKDSIEKFDITERGNYRIALCVNSQTLFCRIEEIEQGHRYLNNFSRSSHVFNSEDGIERYNTTFPKVAWGITAWLLRYTEFQLGILTFYVCKEDVDEDTHNYKCYYERCHDLHKTIYNAVYSTNTSAARTKQKELDKQFNKLHLTQEREYISKLSRHECMSEEHYQAILQCANEYIKWVENEKQNEVQEESSNNSNSERLSLFHADELNFALLLCHLKECSSGKRKIVDIDITTENFANKILSADLSVFPQKVYKIYFLKQISNHYINDGEKTLWHADAIRKAGLTEKDLSQQNESGNTFIQGFEYSKFKVKQNNTTKIKNHR